MVSPSSSLHIGVNQAIFGKFLSGQETYYLKSEICIFSPETMPTRVYIRVEKIEISRRNDFAGEDNID